MPKTNPISCVSCVSSLVLMGKETGPLQLLAPLLLMGGKEADLVIRGNVGYQHGSQTGTDYAWTISLHSLEFGNFGLLHFFSRSFLAQRPSPLSKATGALYIRKKT